MLTCFICRNHMYMCEDSEPFLNTIIDKMETLDRQKLSSTLTAFFQRFEMFSYC